MPKHGAEARCRDIAREADPRPRPPSARSRCSTRGRAAAAAGSPVYDVPIFMQVKVHRNCHAEVARALYSIPGQWIGSVLEVRADSALVKFYARGNLVKVHPRQPAGGRRTDPEDLPTEKVGYAMPNWYRLADTCAGQVRASGSTYRKATAAPVG